MGVFLSVGIFEGAPERQWHVKREENRLYSQPRAVECA
jgi:hypothetical protein